MMGGVTNPQAPRSVKISDDERGGWSSDRPRREGGPARPADISTRCRVLKPSDRVRCSPGSLLLVVSAAETDAEAFLQRVLESPKLALSPGRVRELLEGRVDNEALEARTTELLQNAVTKRLDAGDTAVIALPALTPEAREPIVRAAAANRRPRHLILLETSNDKVGDDDRAPLNELRRRLDAGELGAEGFQTAMRLGGGAIAEVKRIVFRPPPAED
jgi:hypothetical protein